MTDTLSRTLDPPAANWAEELCTRRNPDLIGADSACLGSVVLSYPPRQLADWDVDLDVVRARFEAGLTGCVPAIRIRAGGGSGWRGTNKGSGDPVSKSADGHGQPIAFVLRLARTPANTVHRRPSPISCPVEYESVHEERYCDIGAVYEHVQRAAGCRAARASASRAVHRARSDARSNTAQQHAQALRADARRRAAGIVLAAGPAGRTALRDARGW